MPPSALGLVLGAAVLHAGWNALSKRGGDQLRFLWCAGVVAALTFAPWAAWEVGRGSISAAAWPWVGTSVLLHGAYFSALGRAYRSGALSLVYPVARGLGVALVPLLGLALFGERPSALGGAGIGLVVLGLASLARAPTTAGPRAPGRGLAPGTGWAAATGLLTAAYSLVDTAGVRHLHPVPYITLMFAGVSLLLLPVVLLDRRALVREWRGRRGSILLAAQMTCSAYLLVLFAFQRAPAAYVVAAREVSIVLSALIGSVWFHEGPLAQRLVGATVVLGGVACVALAA